MTEVEFQTSYDPQAFPHLSVTVDLVLMTVRGGKLAALMQRRQEHPFKDSWALPGGFVGMDERLEDAAARIMLTKVGLRAQGWLEQLYTLGDPARDPRTRVITVAYFALLPNEVLDAAVPGPGANELVELEIPWPGEVGGPVIAHSALGAALPLAFDHADILGLAVKRLRGKLDYSQIAFALLAEEFTLLDLQCIHEAILGRSLNKPAFRRRMLDKGWIEGTGQRQRGTSYRPAELYRLKPMQGD